MKINSIPELTKEEIIRVLAKFDIGDYNQCWIWKAAKHPFGYGRVGIRGKSYQAHRVVYKIFKYQPSLELVLDHMICSNPSCVNPHHLREVTHEQNSLRSDIGYCAVKAKAMHCPKGHPLNGDNLWIRVRKGRKNPQRVCLTCHRERKRVANKTDEQNKRTKELGKESRKRRFATKEAKDKKNQYEGERLKAKKEREDTTIQLNTQRF